MTPTSQPYTGDSELQADVMRFMAIIAFCLIAILALVRNVTPAEASQEQSVAAPAAPEETVAEPATAEPAPREAPVTPEPVAPPVRRVAPPEPDPVVTASPAADPVPAPSEPAPVPQATPVKSNTSPKTQTEPPPVEAPRPTEDPGLILRFASDGDFLRLIARGDITVYAFQAHDVLALDGSYRFLESRSPGQVYELLKASIPSLIVDALRGTRDDIDGYHWGIALPERISHQIEDYLRRVDSGQLVIDRYGDVHHVAAT